MLNTKKVMDAIPDINKLLGQLDRYWNRNHPAFSRDGSQSDEDMDIREMLGEELFNSRGTYVDIGASDPVECSNTWKLYQAGWRGLLIEPLYLSWPAILTQRPGDYLSGYAVRNYTGLTRLRVSGSVSSVLPSWNIGDVAELIVPCDTAMNILDRFPSVRDSCAMCSVDVEGIEVEVLQGIDWNVFKPKVLVVEYTTYIEGKNLTSEWIQYIEPYYRQYKENGLNKIYVRK